MNEKQLEIILAVMWDLDSKFPTKKIIVQIFKIKNQEEGWEELAAKWKKYIQNIIND